MFCWETHPSGWDGRASSVRGSSCFDSALSLSVDSSIKSARGGVESECFPCIIGNFHRDSICISCEWNITIGRGLFWWIDSSACAVFVFVGATAHLSRKVTMRQESLRQTVAATRLSAEQCVHVSTIKMRMNKYIHVCAVCLSPRAPLHPARRIPQKVTEPVECEVTPSVIDRLSYFMGRRRACQWAPSQFTWLTRDHLEALAPPPLEEGMEQSKGKVGTWEESHRFLLIYWKRRQWPPDPTKHQSWRTHRRAQKTAHKPYDSSILSVSRRVDRLDKDQMTDAMTHSLSFCRDWSAR